MEYTLRLLFLITYGCVSTVWLRSVVSKAQPGVSRLVLSAPFLFGHVISPLFFDDDREICTRLACFVQFFWLGTFKTLGVCFNRGPLCQSLSFLQYSLVLNLPFTLQDNPGMNAKAPSNSRLSQDGGQYSALLLRFGTKVLIMGWLVHEIPRWKDQRIVVELMHAFSMYFFLGFLMDSSASLASGLLGIKIAPHFDEPYRSSSFTDWWSRRWNLTVGNCLRFLIYDPIMEGTLVRDAKAHRSPHQSTRLRRYLGLQASFLVSAIMHELMLWFLTYRMTGHWFVFFTIQAPIVALESSIKRVFKHRGHELPWWLSIPLTLGLMLILADWFFFPPCFITGLDEKVTSSMRNNIQGLLQVLHLGGERQVQLQA